MPSDFTYKNAILFKTETCRNWDEKGSCRYGEKCRYAHGKEELRPIPRSNQYKTKICKAYHEGGTCSYGIRCTFIHHLSGMKYPPSGPDVSKGKEVSTCNKSPLPKVTSDIIDNTLSQTGYHRNDHMAAVKILNYYPTSYYNNIDDMVHNAVSNTKFYDPTKNGSSLYNNTTAFSRQQKGSITATADICCSTNELGYLRNNAINASEDRNDYY